MISIISRSAYNIMLYTRQLIHAGSLNEVNRITHTQTVNDRCRTYVLK